MRLISIPRVGTAARRVIDTRARLALCPPHSPSWRSLSVEAEKAWQALYETVDRNHAAALMALREIVGVTQ